MQTPTLAILARREQEIRDFKPEPYWVVDARFLALPEEPAPRLRRPLPRRRQPAHRQRRGGRGDRRRLRGQTGTITKVEKRESKDRAPLLYDLTSLQRDASSRFGFTASRTLGAAQRLYEEHKALTYPRTNSRFITSDMIPDIKPIAELVGGQKEYAAAAKYVTGLDVLPLGRVVNNEKVTDHHAIIPTLAERHPVDKMDRRRPSHLRPRRPPLPGRLPPRGGVREHARRDDRRRLTSSAPAARCCSCPAGAASTARASPPTRPPATRTRTTRAPISSCRSSSRASSRRSTGSRPTAKETKPPRRYSDGSLLDAMETAGKLVDDEELREAMKESGIGTPATRAAIIERLLQVGYIERDGRALVVTEKGMNVIRLLGEHALTSPSLTGEWEHRLANIETGAGHARGVHGRHRQVRRGDGPHSSTRR